MKFSSVIYRFASLLLPFLMATAMSCGKVSAENGGNLNNNSGNIVDPGNGGNGGSENGESKPDMPFPENYIVYGDQANRSFVIINGDTFQQVWKWKASGDFIPASRLIWFNNPSEVKPVLNNTHILFTCSGGAVGLIRISDKKMIWYANGGVNPHSAELLPDGNVISVSSTDAKVSIFIPDYEKGFSECVASYKWPAAHAITWDKERKLIYGSRDRAVYAYEYNFKKDAPAIKAVKKVREIPSDENCVHDLYPILGEKDWVWMTTNEAVSKLNVLTGELIRVNTYYAVKSVSNDPKGNMLMLKPTESWWSDSMIDQDDKIVFTVPGAKIYKGRYMYLNTFSY